MRYVKAVLYALIVGAIGFIAMMIPFVFARNNGLPSYARPELGQWPDILLSHHGTVLIWLVSLLPSFYAAFIMHHAGWQQMALFAPIYAPLIYAVALLLFAHLNML